MPVAVTVPVIKPTSSTINWVQIAGLIASAAAFFKLNVSPETIASILIGIQSAVALYTIVRHTYFGNRVVSTSVPLT